MLIWSLLGGVVGGGAALGADSVDQLRAAEHQYSKQAQTVSSRGGLVAGRARVFDPDIANHSKKETPFWRLFFGTADFCEAKIRAANGGL